MRKVTRSYKVIIDTNIWISFLIGKSLQGIQNHINSRHIKIITCDEQIVELTSVFNKPKIKKYFTKEQVIEFFELLEESSLRIKIKTKSDLCRDPKDNYLVSLALDSKADYLITGDHDLLELKIIDSAEVINYTNFNKIIKQLT